MKRVIKTIIFLALVVVMLVTTYKVLSWKDTSGEYFSCVEQLEATGDNLIDVVFMGSSHCYCGINPSVLWETYGISGFDMSVSGQDKESTYYHLKHLLKTQSPKVVFVDVFAMTYEEHEHKKNVYRNMLALPTSKNSVDLVKKSVDKEEWGDFFLRWPIVHTRYRELERRDFEPGQVNSFGRGHGVSYYSIPVAWDPVCEDVDPISESNRAWIDSLVALSEEYNFELVMLAIPAGYMEKEQRILNGCALYFEELGIPYLNYHKNVDEIGLNFSLDFIDGGHLNTRGADKTTARIGEYLVENYDLEDHRGDEAYYLWDECSEYIDHMELKSQLQEPREMLTYMTMLKASKDTVVIISLDGNFHESTLDFQAVANVFGIPETEYFIGGKWIMEDGEITYYMNPGEDDAYIRELSKYNTLRMRNIPGELNQIEINDKALTSAYNGLSIVVYDKVLNSVIDQKGYF